MISYCITVYNEIDYIKTLLDKLNKVILPNEEIIVFQTYRENHEKNETYFSEIQNTILSYPNIRYQTFHFQASITGWNSVKNHMNSFSTKKYIFNIDADEDYPENAFDIIRNIINQTDFDLLLVPRVNIVDGLTEEDIKSWNWNVNEKGWINWPDYQPRIYKNSKNILWGGGPHDGILGAESVIGLEALEEVAIIHKKDIHRQRDQNNLYDKILSNNKEIKK